MTGLTMVGIHERSGREKISTSKVAHIMNNELERKYLTSIKRLMTYAQTKRTDVAPSMKMLNK
jgi:pre-mRNA-splicing factor 18